MGLQTTENVSTSERGRLEAGYSAAAPGAADAGNPRVYEQYLLQEVRRDTRLTTLELRAALPLTVRRPIPRHDECCYRDIFRANATGTGTAGKLIRLAMKRRPGRGSLVTTHFRAVSLGGFGAARDGGLVMRGACEVPSIQHQL